MPIAIRKAQENEIFGDQVNSQVASRYAPKGAMNPCITIALSEKIINGSHTRHFSNDSLASFLVGADRAMKSRQMDVIATVKNKDSKAWSLVSRFNRK